MLKRFGAPIAQLDRAPDYESVGRVFESPWARQLFQGVTKNLRVLVTPFFAPYVGIMWDFHPTFSKTFIASCSASPME